MCQLENILKKILPALQNMWALSSSKGTTINDLERLKIYFFLEGGLRNFFPDFLRPHPQIINGRPLSFSYHKCSYRISISQIKSKYKLSN